MAPVPALKACLFLRRSKTWQPWTEMRRRRRQSAPHSLPASSAPRNQAFLFGKSWKESQISPFFPRTNKHSGIAGRSLRGNDMFVSVLGAVAQRFNDPQVGSNHGGKQKRLPDLARKRQTCLETRRSPFLMDSAITESGQVDLIKALSSSHHNSATLMSKFNYFC